MIQRAATGLALLLVVAGCAAPPPSVTPTAPVEPSPIGSPSSAGAMVTIDADGRYHCEWVAGCAPFVAIEPTDGILVDTLPEGWLPPEPYLLEQTRISGTHGDQVASVGGPTRAVDPLQAGTYRVTAGSLWVDDTATTSEGPNAPNVFMRVGDPGSCQMPLEVTDTTENVSVDVTFQEGLYCDIALHGGPGAELDVGWAGELQCTTFPYGCATYLSVLEPGAEVTADWRPEPHDPWWSAAASGDALPSDDPVWTVPNLPAGRHRLLFSLLGGSDLLSFTPDGEIARDLLSRCSLDVAVAPSTTQVGVLVTFVPDGVGYGGSCSVERTE